MHCGKAVVSSLGEDDAKLFISFVGDDHYTMGRLDVIIKQQVCHVIIIISHIFSISSSGNVKFL